MLMGKINYSPDATMECLYHHGILGQKWGDRNGPPYPLDNKDRSSAERNENLKSYQQLEKDFKGINSFDPTEEESQKYKELWDKISESSFNVEKGIPISEGTKAIFKEKEKLLDKETGAIKSRALFEHQRDNDQDLIKAEKEHAEYVENFINDYMKKNGNILTKTFSFEEAALHGKAMRALRSDVMNQHLTDKESSAYSNASEKALSSTKYKKLKENESATIKRLNSELLGTILKDIGYEDTPDAREYIRGVVFWD